MNTKTKLGLGAVGVVAIAATGTGIGFALTGGDDDDVTGQAADQARAAATQAVPGATAGEVDNETGEGNATYGVAVTKPDGTKLEVHLDQGYHVRGTEPAATDHDTDEGL